MNLKLNQSQPKFLQVIIIVSIQKRKYLTNWKMNGNDIYLMFKIQSLANFSNFLPRFLAHQKFLMILANLAPLLFANLQSMKKEETG